MRIEDYKITITHIDTGRTIVTDEVTLAAMAAYEFYPQIEVVDCEFEVGGDNGVYLSSYEAFVEDEAQLLEDTITDACKRLFHNQEEDKS